jgi:1,4-dihydroxy-2-naphthoyl-CoA synthase
MVGANKHRQEFRMNYDDILYEQREGAAEGVKAFREKRKPGFRRLER